MGAQQSKEELLYQQVDYGNVAGIHALRREGAGLEWIDKDGKTPLILASMRPELLHVVKALIDLGANVNAYRPGSHAGTPLHHAAKRGLVQTVDLLLAHGANPAVMNDDCQTAIDLARAKGHWNTVRLIESRICLFSGWLREVYGPSILEVIVKQWMSRKIWAVVLPCDSRNPMRGPKYELALYPELQVAQPNSVIPLWKAHIEEPILNQPDPALVIVDKATRKRYKFHPEHEGDKRQLQMFYNACRGILQNNNYVPEIQAGTHMPMTAPPNPHPSASPQPAPEDVELAMAINASIQSAIADGIPLHSVQQNAEPSFNGLGSSLENTSHNGWGTSPAPSTGSTQAPSNKTNADPYNGWAVPEVRQPEARPNSSASQPNLSQLDIASAEDTPFVAQPSAPPMTGDTFFSGPIQYPSIDSSLVDLTVPTIQVKPGTCEEAKEGGSSSNPGDSTNAALQMSNDFKEGGSISGSCVICLDAPVEGACIPCGHVAGCMSCLNEIKAKKWGCPVCRAKIAQVIKLYAV